MGGIYHGCTEIYDCSGVGGCYFWSHSMLILLPAKTIVLMVVLRSELSPRFSVFWGYYVCNHAQHMDVTMVVFCCVCLRSCVGCWSIVVFCHRKHALPVVCWCWLPGKWFMHPY